MLIDIQNQPTSESTPEGTNPSLAREEREEQRRQKSAQRRRRLAIGSAVLLLVTGWAGILFYGYAKLQQQSEALPRLAATEQSLESLAQQGKVSSSRLSDWLAKQDRLKSDLDGLAKRFAANVDDVREQANQGTEAVFHRAQAEIDRQSAGLRNRLAGMESSRDADRLEIATLQDELRRMRSDIASQEDHMAVLRQQTEENRSAAQTRLASLRQDQISERHDLDTLAGNLAVDRIDFELSKGKMRELAPGISLDLKGTDTTRRRVTGLLSLLPEQRTISLRGQGVLEPVVFYGSDGKKRELVITSVVKNSIVGYLLLPKEGTTGDATAIAVSKPVSNPIAVPVSNAVNGDVRGATPATANVQ